MLTLFCMIFSVIVQRCISTDTPLLNCTWQFVFNSEKWNTEYANQSSEVYITKSLEITGKLKNTFATMMSSILVTSLSQRDPGVIVTVLIGATSTLDKNEVNKLLVGLNATILEPSPNSTCGVTTSTTPPMTTNAGSISSMLPNVTITTQIMTTSQSSTLSTTNTVITNLYSTTPISVKITGSSDVTTNSPNTSEFVTNITTTTNGNITTPSINFSVTTPVSTSITSSNINSTTNMSNLNSTINMGNLTTFTNSSTIPSNTNTASTERNNSTSALGVSVTTPSSTMSGASTSAATSSIKGSTTVKDVTGSTTATQASGVTLNLLSTTVSVSRKQYSIRFADLMWIESYTSPDNIAYKNMVLELIKKISTVLNVSDSMVLIYGLEPGSLIAKTGIPANFTIPQINNGLKNLNAKIVEPTPSTNPPILPNPSPTSPSTSSLPTYAIILISIFSTALIIVILFVVTAIICRHRRIKGYGRHQVQFFEMENGWKYGTRNQTYHRE